MAQENNIAEKQIVVKLAIELNELISQYNKTNCPEVLERIKLKQELLKDLKNCWLKNEVMMPANEKSHFDDIMRERRKLAAEFTWLRNKMQQELTKFQRYNDKARIWNRDTSRTRWLDESAS
jgi:hypothetical protein